MATATRRRRSPGAAPAAGDGADQLHIDIPLGARQLEVRYVARAEIHPDPDQPRLEADAELRASIARNGLLQPITVRPHPEILGEYMIVDGERRWRGSEGVLDELPVVVRVDQDDPALRLRTQLVANTGRPLTPIEEARAYAQLLEENGGNQTALAAELGIARTTLNERLHLLDLGPWVELIAAGTLPLSHAVKYLLPLRTAPAEVHVTLIEKITADYRWSDGSISAYHFGNAVNEYVAPFMYPLTKAKATVAWSAERNPTFDTRDHDHECDCGGIGWGRHDGFRSNLRKHCVNPGYWRARHRKGLAAQKAEEAASAKTEKVKLAGPRIDLPPEAGSVVVRSRWEDPAGVELLTDTNGLWVQQDASGHGPSPFDPADLTIHPGALVRVRATEYDGARDRVGLRDELAVSAARQKWADRWEVRRAQLEGELARTLADSGSAYGVAGPGVRPLLPLLARHYPEGIIDLADALGIEVSEEVATARQHELGGKVSAWVWELDEQDAERLATGMATATARSIELTSRRLLREQRERLVEIRQQPVPWVKLSKKDQERAARIAAETAPRTCAGCRDSFEPDDLNGGGLCPDCEDAGILVGAGAESGDDE